MALAILRHAGQKPPLGPLKVDLGRSSLAFGLVGDWLMNDYGSRSLYDASGRSQAGALGAPVTWTTDSVGPALAFTQTAATGVNVGSSPGLNLGASTCSFLMTFKIASADVFLFHHLYGGYDGGTFVGSGVMVGQANAGVPAWWSSAQGGWTDMGTTNYADGAWHTLVVTINSASSGTSYVDRATNTAAFSGTDLRPGAYTGNRFLGSDVNSATGTALKGLLSRVAVWNRAITAAEVDAILTEPYALYQTRPLQLPPTGPPTIPPGLGPVVQMSQPMMIPPP